MFASLPMYDWPENRAGLDVFYGLVRDRLRDRGIDAPDALDHGTPPPEGWAREDLLLGQICNLPLRRGHDRGAHRIATWDPALAEAPAGHYYSVFVVRADAPSDDPLDYMDATLAINEADSHSGWGAPEAWAAARGAAWTRAAATGAHADSARAVAEGRADIAAIDAVTWALHLAPGPLAARLRIIGRTDASPCMTLITRHPDPAAVGDALAAAAAVLDPAIRAQIGLAGLATLPKTAYDLPDPPPPPL